MWKRLMSQSSSLSRIDQRTIVTALCRSFTPKQLTNGFLTSSSSPSSPPPSFQRNSPLYSSDKSLKGKVEYMPIATGHELEELEAELQGRNILEMNFPVGPFGTKEVPAIVQSVYNKRIVGCPGGEGEDEHDVVWFWLEKGKPHECPVCSQYFMLEVVGPGYPPDGHGNDDHR